MAKRFIIMAGGTGGHVIPALAIAHALKANGHDVMWLGTKKGLEATLVPEAGFPLYFLSVKGLRGSGIIRKLLAPWMLLTSFIEARRYLKQLKPAAVIGMGGYVSGPGGIAAKCLKIPLILHEQNSLPGTTNRCLARVADHIFTAFPGTFSNNPKTICVGNPVREEIVCLYMDSLPEFTPYSDTGPGMTDEQRRMTDEKIDPSHNLKESALFHAKAGNPSPEGRNQNVKKPFNLLIFGGSRGARAINELIPKALESLENVEVWHQTGEGLFEETKGLYMDPSPEFTPYSDKVGHTSFPAPRLRGGQAQAGNPGARCASTPEGRFDLCENAKDIVISLENGKSIHLSAYISDMAKAYQWADLIICRSGAMSVFELMAAGKPSILIPYPHASDDHQTHNAQYLVEKKAAFLLPQQESSVERLVSMIQCLQQDQVALLQMANSAHQAYQGNCVKHMVEEIEKWTS